MTMNMMKKTMVAAAGLVIAASAMADASFDELVALSRTSADKTTASNAQALYDASLAVTNTGKIYFLVSKKFIAADVAYTKALELGWTGLALSIANSTSNTAWHVELAGKLADKVIAIPVDDPEYKTACTQLKSAIQDNKKYLLLTDTDALLAIADKLIAAEKWAPAAMTLFSFQAKECIAKRVEVVNAKYLDLIYAKLASGTAGDFWNKFAYFDTLATAWYAKDYEKFTFPDEVLEKLYCDIRDYEAFAMNWNGELAKSLVSIARPIALKSPNLSDKKRIAVAAWADGAAKDKKSTASIYDMIKDKNLRLGRALYLNDTDKIIDAFGAIDSSASAERIDQTLTVINALDVDYRAADVLKALRNANAKYTLKLYDDRDTWEPILSKMRAMIETR